jgi:hypothetical protein
MPYRSFVSAAAFRADMKKLQAMAQIVVYLFLHAVFRQFESGAVLAAFPEAAAHMDDLFHVLEFHRCPHVHP